MRIEVFVFVRAYLLTIVACLAVVMATACAARGPLRQGDANAQAPIAREAPRDSLETAINKVRAQSERARPRSPSVQALEATDAALARALLAVKARPTVKGHHDVAEQYVRLGILDLAHDHLSAAVALDPTDASAWDGLARIWRDWGFPHLALPDSHRAVYFAPHSPVVHNTLGTILQALGRRVEARREYERALALDMTAAYALTNLCYGWVLEGQPTKAAAACREALRLQPQLQPARNNLALAYEAGGDLPAALDLFASASIKGRAEYNTGIVHLARRRYGEALKAFEAARALRPGFRAAEAMARMTRRELTQGSEP